MAERTGAEALLTADEVAEMLRVPRSWVYAESRCGRLPTVRLGRYYRYRAPAIAAWVAAAESAPFDPYRRYSPAAPGH